MARTEWLSEGAEKLALEPRDAEGFHCDVAIVGSGYGGAVAAARLAGLEEAKTGKLSRVWVLERGNEFAPGAFPERFADLVGQARLTWGKRPKLTGRPEGLFDLRLGRDVSALVGNGLGGGSLINAGVLARPHSSVFREPWPQGVNLEALERHFMEVERMLGAGKLKGPAPPKLRALEALGQVIDGHQADRRADIAVCFREGKSTAGVKQHACIACGDCFTGCNHGAKNTLPTNYLALARQRGARLFTGITVLSVDGSDAGWALDFRFTDRQIARRFGIVPGPLRARRVILAAGAYGSTGILLRSRAAGFAALSGRLGSRFSTNGDMIAAGYGMPTAVHAGAQEGTPPESRGVGPTITGMIDLRERRVPLVIEELAVPAALRRVFEEVVTTLAALHGLARPDYSPHRADGLGTDPAAIDAERIARTAVYATMGDDGARGCVALAERPATADRLLQLDEDVCVRWRDVADCEVFREGIRVLEEAHAGTDALLLPNPMWRALPPAIGRLLDDGPIGGSVLTVHPLGGCPMADSGAQGVVNRFGQVFRDGAGTAVHETLVVLDGAIVPTALEINPCLTIAALAEYGAAGLVNAWDMRDARRPLCRLGDIPRPVRLGWPASEPTGIRLAERLTGRLRLAVDGPAGARIRDFEATLEIEYREIVDLERFLVAGSKSMPVAKARLHLHAPAVPGSLNTDALDWQGTVELAGELRPFEREASGAARRVFRAGLAYLCNRGVREIAMAVPRWAWQGLKALVGLRGPGGPGLKEVLRNWLAVASQAGEARLLTYELAVCRDVTLGPPGPGATRVLSAGDRLRGRKRIAYVAALPWWDSLLKGLVRVRRLRPLENVWPSPWDQATRLPLELRRVNASAGFAMGSLRVDLPYFVRQYATQLQITGQENQPRALADLLSLFMYLVRVVGRIHIWSFRAPDYPKPYPEYEFDGVGRAAAEAAGKEAGVKVKSRLKHRLPGDVPGLHISFERVLPQPKDEPDAPAPFIRLTRYRKENAGGGPAPQPVLLIHGLGAGGNTFTLKTIRECLVKHLADHGFDPWVLDLRTSIGLSCSKHDWSFDDAASGDIPAAIETMRKEIGAVPVDVVAHCIGAAMFSMAALQGKLPKDAVRKAVLSQAGPLMELPPENRFRGYLASYFKYYLQIDEFDTAASLTRFTRFLDRILAAYPYPRHEWHEHLSLLPVRHETYCLRTYGIYGRLFEHANLNRKTLEHLGDYIGHVRYETYQQTIFYATMRRLTDRLGKNVYVTPENIQQRLQFPLCFLHGAENSVFDARTSRRSYDLLASIFRRSGQLGERLRLVEIPGYGHQDCMIGKDAHRDVYPKIVEFLKAGVPGGKPAQGGEVFVVRPPRLGPVLGWLRSSKSGTRRARVILVPNDSGSEALYALTFFVENGAPLAGSGRLHRLRAPREKGPPVKMLDVRIPRGAEARLVIMTVHRELHEPQLQRETEEPAPDDPFGEDFEHVLERANLPTKVDDAVKVPAAELDPYLAPVFQACRDLGIDGEPLGMGRRVSDRRYAAPVSTAILARDVLAAADRAPGDGVCFALASCRYASNVTDRELADRKFGRLRDLLERPGARRAPQFLFLAGDAIYADATYGIFDPTLGTERYDQRYFEAWTAPNAQEVLRRLPTYPMLDDHEVEENFEGVPDAPEGQAGLRAYEAFQAMLTPRGRVRARGPYWYPLQAEGFDFFVADTRTARRRGRGAASLEATIGEDMMAALKRWLLEAQKRRRDAPKFIASPSVVVPWTRETHGHRAYMLRSDAWDAFPDSLHELLGFIALNGIANVVFLSGDYHCSVFARMELKRGGGAPVRAYSVVSSGLYSPYPFANARFGDLEFCFQGTHRDWLKKGGAQCCDRLGELEIRYVAQPMAPCASFAIIEVARRGVASWMTVRFDEGQVVSVRLS